ASRPRPTAAAPCPRRCRPASPWRGPDRAVSEKRARPTGHSVGPMFNAISHSAIYVLDQDEALNFYVGKLGLEVGADVDLGFMRWLTVTVPGQPDRQILLERPAPPSVSEETAAQVRDLLTK